MDRFDAVALDDWRDRTGFDWLSVDGLAPEYEAVEAELSIEAIPAAHHNRNTQLFTEAFDKRGYGWKPLRRAQGNCALDRGSDCIVCLGGCPRESKQSTLVTSIRSAREAGLEVRPGCQVTMVEERGETVVVSGEGFSVSGRAVVLAAGALGTTEILLRAGFGKRLPALGTRFACHPQVMTYAMFEQPVDAHKGAFQAVKSDDAALRAKGLKFENVFAPPIGTSMLLPLSGRELHKVMRGYRRMASMEVAIRDEAAGTMRLDKKGKLQVDKPVTSADQAKINEGLEIVRELFVSVGAQDIIPCTDTFGLHLMGGAPLGADERTSAVGADFRVHGSQRVFAADSAVFPSAPGINPSLTIMALTERASRSVQEVAA